MLIIEYTEIINYGKCPNCESNNYDITKRICYDCGYRLDHNHPNGNWHKKELIQNFENTEKKYKFKFGDFESYQIILKNNKIDFIKFKFQSKQGEKEFIVHIDYKLENKVIYEIHYNETDPEEREKHFNITKIKNLKILYINEKTNTNHTQNYLNNLGIKQKCFITFIQNLLEKFHSE